MKKLLPAFLPFILIAALVIVLLNTSRLKGFFGSDASSDDPTTQVDNPSDTPSPVDIEKAIVPSPLDKEEAEPKASTKAEKKSARPFYPSSKYPFVNKPFKWKKQRAWSYKHIISFNSDGSVSQNFWPKGKSGTLRWKPNHNYSLILSDGNNWTVDIVFNTQYNNFTARRREQTEVYSGKINR